MSKTTHMIGEYKCILHLPVIRIIIPCLIFFHLAFLAVSAQRLSRDLNVDLLINQIGYLPDASKSVIVKGNIQRNFDVIDLETKKTVFRGNFLPDTGDFGKYSIGDFSSLEKEGYYYIKSDTLRSYPFRISGKVYQPAMDMIVGYFPMQRCGSSTTGYLSPCHLDDGKRMDNGKHQDVTGGWHDASDLRKWVEATIYGMIGLAKTWELHDNDSRGKILEELMWGNEYFLKMQEPQGYVMEYIGGDVLKGSDSNRWTDNEIAPEGGELRMVKPTSGKSTREMLIFGESDDRVIHTDPVDMLTQYNFISTQAMMARITEESDMEYSRNCLIAAIKCFEWCTTSDEDLDPRFTGAAIQAGIEMYKTTKQDIYRIFAIQKAEELHKMQAQKQENPSGFFYTSSSNTEPYKDIYRGCLELISMCDLIQAFPLHKNVPLWEDMISKYAYNYLLFMSGKNSFGIIPYGLYTEKDPGGNRKAGEYWYRYFMEPELSWWTGINANIASAGVGLIKAAEILNDNNLRALAQKQFDWIVGVNPFNSSTMHGVGHNHPIHYSGNAFLPGTPVIPGAVMNGLGGDHADQPDIGGKGNWMISEYWTPMVVYTLWLIAELSKK